MAVACSAIMTPLRNNIARKRVLWFGTAPSEEILREFTNRELVVEVLPNFDGLLPQLLPTSCGIVLDMANEPASLLRFFTDHSENTADHGLLHLMLARNHTEISRIQSLQPEFSKKKRPDGADRDDFVRLQSNSNHEVAEKLARWDPGPGKGTIQIHGEPADGDTLFFERAFSDCKEIWVDRLPGGRSGTTYCVYATFLEAQNGSRPFPFFAKSDNLYKIENEKDKYHEFVNPYVPFHLRPDLDEPRCVRGAHRGMLVGDFVEKSESFRAVAARGHAQAAIFSLFENALGGLRLQAYPVADPLPTIWEKMNSSFDPAEFAANQLERLGRVRDWGGAAMPVELYRQLRTVANVPALIAPMHGDLHTNNIRVRGYDAILIDFNSMRARMPLTIDPASLEVSLVFGCGEKFENGPDFPTWQQMVGRLYAFQHLLHCPPPPDRPNEREWFWATVRQIRQVALSSQNCDWEYATVLVFNLLRHANFGNPYSLRDPRRNEDEARRSYAYLIAERITGEIVRHVESARRQN